jgi:hypothetical protein
MSSMNEVTISLRNVHLRVAHLLDHSPNRAGHNIHVRMKIRDKGYG